ncbi:MAG: hypothetical protein K9L84_01490 [Candidatus Omnitrophica bacterium]|nr:hypothetical protein [Candidatus Omnitrophota bacterium]MCF7893717.1 hypothetical protein [Candidatus Omnitrophota bacterium]
MKKIVTVIFFLIVFMPSFVGGVFAETIVFNSGKIIEADIIELTRDDIKVNLRGAESTYSLDQIKSISAEKDSTFSKKYLNKKNDSKKSLTKKSDKDYKKLKDVKKIQDLLEKNRNKLKQKRKEYIQAKKELKNIARTGFFGFGRTNAETKRLLKAKEKVVKLKKEYNSIKRAIKGLKKELNLAREIEILQKKQKRISNSF